MKQTEIPFTATTAEDELVALGREIFPELSGGQMQKVARLAALLLECPALAEALETANNAGSGLA